jgi:DNA replication ATP-dependent helicase Dna2
MSIIEEFRAAIELHQRKDDENFDEQMVLPLQERISKGITMTNLRVSFLIRRPTITVHD